MEPAADPGRTATGLVRRMISVAAGSRFEGTASPGGELWFMIAGSGRLDTGSPGQRDVPVAQDMGMWLLPRCRYRLDADSDVRLDAVALPAAELSGPGLPGSGLPGSELPGSGLPATTATGQGPRVVRLADCEVEQTGDRQFRVLLGPGRGCEAATQFVGQIPPGRAPEHSHPYDEVVLVLAGEGVAHAGGTDRALAPGTQVHLPRGLPHCLENTGRDSLVVLGVFHPGGSPAAKSAPATTRQARQ
jgi:quercetin dioxygenase-like cupin family protein